MNRRTPLRKKGRRALRDQEALAAFRANPPSRCERCNRRRKLHPHHMLPRSRGGKHEAENRAWLCFHCHRLVHDHLVDDWRDWIR